MTLRDDILKSAADLYAQHGFRATTTRMIAEAAGVNEVTLFRHFGSKASLIEAAVRSRAEAVFADSLPEVPVDPVRELERWCREQMEHLSVERALISRFMSELRQYPEMLSCVRAAPTFTATGGLAEYMARLKHLGAVEKSVDSKAAIQLLRGAIFLDVLWRDVCPENLPSSIKKAQSLYATMFLRAIGFDADQWKQRTASGSKPLAKKIPARPRPVRKA